RRAFAQTRRGGRAAESSRIAGTEIGGAVDRVEEADIGGVEEIEPFGQEFDAALLLQPERPADAEIHRTEVVANEGVARFNADAVVVAEDVAIGVESGE